MFGTVARGARWLDRAQPGWENFIHRPIDLCSDYNCVIGQVFGDFDTFVRRRPFRAVALMPVRGVLIWPGSRAMNYLKPRMEAQWRAEVEKRMQVHREARAAYARTEAGIANRKRREAQEAAWRVTHGIAGTDLALSGD
jgi:hypothetical protein